MYNKKFKYLNFDFLKAFSAVIVIIIIFLRPHETFSGVIGGLNICYNRLIPSLFPFFIATGLFMSSSLARTCGIVFTWYTKLLGIKSKKAASGMLLGLLGGFAGTGAIAYSLYNEGELSKSESEIFLCATAASGPSFVINTVGFGMLNNSSAGLLLYIATLLASLATGLVMRLFIAPTVRELHTNKKYEAQSISQIIQAAINTMLSLCGFVTAFSFLAAVLIPQAASPIVKYIFSSALEVTIGCTAASALSCNKLYFVCAALSALGLCAVLQIQAFCKDKISVKPFVFSRIIHIAFSLLFLKIALLISPVSLAVSSFEGYKAQFRLPADTCMALFILIIAFFFDYKALPCLLKQKKKV